MPETLWTPPDDVRDTTEIGRYLNWLERERGLHFADYAELWQWSIDDLEGFWSSIWEFYDVRAHTPYDSVLANDDMPGATWFPGARLNYAEHLVGTPDDEHEIAIVARGQTRPEVTLTWGDFRDQVARARAGLQRLGVKQGDRVVAYTPNIPETLIAFTAAASLGAIWASCAPELGARSAIDRLGQLEPTVLLAVGSYGFRDRTVDRRNEIDAIRQALPTIEHVVDVPYGEHGVRDATTTWHDLTSDHGGDAELTFDPVPFDHPLYVLFSSGTTGKPKAIVHGHGGILLEHLKVNGLSWDLKPGGRILWFSTTSWMMWNALISSLTLRASVVMLDGDPAYPSPDWQWQVAAETNPTFMGAAPAFITACRKAGLHPGQAHDLSSIKIFATAGSPLPPDGYRYLHDELPHAMLLNGSGGTDICSGIVGGSPIQPVYEGEISGPNLGVAAYAFDPDGNVITDELGELVITRPMPSMPLSFWGDDGSRYREAYFDTYPGVWRQGDWIRFTERGSCVLTGRSDATLNRGGVRLGTGEFYSVIEEFPEVTDSLVVHLEDDDGGAGRLLLFVVQKDHASDLDDDLKQKLARALKTELSPRHIPDEIHAVPAIPRTLTGKKLEAPVKRILRGAAPDEVASRDALADPTALDPFAALAGRTR